MLESFRPLKNLFFLLIVSSALVAATRPGLADSAREMLAAGRVDDAISTLNLRLSSSPADAESANLLCRAYFALEDWNRAETSCKQAIELDPNNSNYHRWMGHVYGEKADHSGILTAATLATKTRDELERAVELNPNNIDARVDLAEYYFEAPAIMGGGLDKARAEARIIGQTNPAREHWVYARLAEKSGNVSTAETEYRQMIQLSNNDSEAWLNFSSFLHRQKRDDEMEQALIKASQSRMSKPDVLFDIAKNLYHTGRNPDLSIQSLRRYLASGPVEEAPAFKAHYLLGTILEKQGDKPAAMHEYQAALALARQFGLAQQALNRIDR